MKTKSIVEAYFNA